MTNPPPRTPTNHAYLHDVHRFLRWHTRRYGETPVAESLAPPALTRYWQWCASHLSAQTIQRRKIALRWFVEIHLAHPG